MISNLKYFSLVIGHHYLEGSNPCSKDLTYIMLESHFVFSDYWWIKKLIPYGQWTKFTWCHEPINCFSSQLTDSRLKNVTDCQPNRFFKSHHSDTSHLLLPETGKIVCNNSNQKTPPMPPIHYIYKSYNNPNNNKHSRFRCYHVSTIMLHQKWLTLSECVEAVFAWHKECKDQEGFESYNYNNRTHRLEVWNDRSGPTHQLHLFYQSFKPSVHALLSE